jgi:hypothetical protein
MANEQLLKYIQSKAAEFGKNYAASRIAFLQKRKITVTDELINSIATETKIIFDRATVETVIAFEEHGRYIEMKGLNPSDGGADYLLAVEAWIKKRGWDKFEKKFEAKYGEVLNQYKGIRRLAWGIIRNRNKKKFKPKRWHTRARAAQVGELYNSILAGMGDIVTNEIKGAFGSLAK